MIFALRSSFSISVAQILKPVAVQTLPILRALAAASLAASLAPALHAGVDTSGAVSYAPEAVKPAAIDGKDDEWNRSTFNYAALSEGDLNSSSCEYAFMWDRDNFYCFVKVKDDTPMRNDTDTMACWKGDCIELRMASMPIRIKTSMYAIKEDSPEAKDLQYYFYVPIWFNHIQQQAHILVNQQCVRGSVHRPVPKMDPEGSKGVFRMWDDQKGYNLEAQIPWRALNVSRRCSDDTPRTITLPFGMSIMFSSPSGKAHVCKIDAMFNSGLGTMGFLHLDKWGDLKLLPRGEIPPATKAQAYLHNPKTKKAGVPIPLALKEEGIATARIFGESGEILRELVDEHALPETRALNWDGKDRFGRYVKAGTYRYDLMTAPRIQARYIGAAGNSGRPPYETPDGLGGWGSDVAFVNDTTCDATGIYFLWSCTDGSGKTVVKIGHDGNTLWRVAPAPPPFSGASWGVYSSIASDGTYVYLLNGAIITAVPGVMCLDALTGKVVDSRMLNLSDYKQEKKTKPAGEEFVDFVGTGLAVADGKGYASLFYENKIKVFDLAAMTLTGEMALERPYGLCVDKQGDLYALSRGSSNSAARLVRFKGGQGEATPVVTRDLEAPVDVGCLPDGSFLITDAGENSQQAKIFSPNGVLKRALGVKGGRPWSGKYDPDNLLMPWGLTVLADGSFVIVEQEVPGVITHFNPEGKALKRWYGPAAYGTGVFPDTDNPFCLYYLADFSYPCLVRTRIDSATGEWVGPEYYWNPQKSPWPIEMKETSLRFSTIMMQAHQRKYIIGGGALTELQGDTLAPVMAMVNFNPKKFQRDKPELRLVSYRTDPSGKVINSCQSSNLPAGRLKGPFFNNNLDLYFVYGCYGGTNRQVICVPFGGIASNGVHRWQVDKVHTVINDFAPLYQLSNRGHTGLRFDHANNIYVAWAGGPASSGLYWSGAITYARVAKFKPTGERLWEVGLKAMGKRQDGEMYNIWSSDPPFDDDRYVSVADETGPILYYTSDGFYRGHILNDLADGLRGPYSMSAESFSAGVTLRDKKTGKYYACRGSHVAACLYELTGLGNEKITGGTLTLTDSDLEQFAKNDTLNEPVKTAGHITAIPRTADPKNVPWKKIRPTVLNSGARQVGCASIAYDDANLFCRFDFPVARALMNDAAGLALLFAGGDWVSLCVGPSPSHKQPLLGDTRLMIAPREGRVAIVGMKPKTAGESKPYLYETDTRKQNYEYFGEVPGANGWMEPSLSGDGQSLVIQVPLSFFDMPLFRGGNKICFNVEMGFSDVSGKKTAEQYWAFKPPEGAATVVNEILSCAVLYQDSWQETELTEKAAP